MKKLTIIALLLIFSCSKENVEYESNQLTETEIILSSFYGSYEPEAGTDKSQIHIRYRNIFWKRDINYGLEVVNENELKIYIIDEFHSYETYTKIVRDTENRIKLHFIKTSDNQEYYQYFIKLE